MVVINDSRIITLTPGTTDRIQVIAPSGDAGMYLLSYELLFAIKPALNLKSSVIITGGDGTKENPFEIILN